MRGCWEEEEGGCRAANEKYSGKMGKGTERVMKEARRVERREEMGKKGKRQRRDCGQTGGSRVRTWHSVGRGSAAVRSLVGGRLTSHPRESETEEPDDPAD